MARCIAARVAAGSARCRVGAASEPCVVIDLPIEDGLALRADWNASALLPAATAASSRRRAIGAGRAPAFDDGARQRSGSELRNAATRDSAADLPGFASRRGAKRGLRAAVGAARNAVRSPSDLLI